MLMVVTTVLVAVLVLRAYQTDRYFEVVNAEAGETGQKSQAIIIN